MSSKTVVKISFNDSIRRFEVPVNSFDEFYASISKTLKLFTPFRVAYQDTEGDVVTFDSTEELKEALLHARVNDVLRVTVQMINEPSSSCLKAEGNDEDVEKADVSLAVPVEEKKPQTNPPSLSNKEAKKFAKLEKKALKQSIKGEKKALKIVKKADKLEAKLERQEEKAIAKRDTLARSAAFQSLCADMRAKRDQVAASEAQLKQTRQQLRALGSANAAAAQTLRSVLNEQVAQHKELKSQLQRQRQAVQAARRANKALPLQHKGADQQQVELPLAVADRQRLTCERFAQHGLDVVLLTQQEMVTIKEQGKGAFQQFRKAQQAEGKVVLMPAFVRRLMTLNTNVQLDQLVANKAKVLLSKGNGTVTGSAELAQQQAAIHAKQAELVRVRTELRDLRLAFKQSFQQKQSGAGAAATATATAAEQKAVVGNTPLA